jgi:hypothetical protein
MDDVGNWVYVFYSNWVYFGAIEYILWPLGTFHGYLIYIFPFWYIVPGKIWHPCVHPCSAINRASQFHFAENVTLLRPML